MRKQLIKKVLTTSLAAAMVMSMGMPVFAGTYKNAEGSDPASVTTIDDYTIHKTVTTATGVTVPTGAIYTFTVTPDTGAPAMFTNNTTTLTQAQINAGTSVTDAVFSKEKFDNAKVDYGIYTYTISEDTIKVGSDNASDVNWTKDPATYTAKVKYTADGIYVTLQKTVNNETAAKSADPASFTNYYTAFGGDDGKDGGSTANSLKISKTASGEGYKGTETFKFTINVSDSEVVDKSKKPKYNGVDFDYNTDKEIEITVTAKDTAASSSNITIPVGASYTVKETDSQSASGTKVSVNGATATDYTTAGVTGSITSRTQSQTIAFTNTKDVTGVLTGITNQYGGLLAVVAIAAVGIVFVAVRRRREA